MRSYDDALEILELAKSAHFKFKSASAAARRELLPAILSNCRFSDGSLTVEYNSPFGRIGTPMCDIARKSRLVEIRGRTSNRLTNRKENLSALIQLPKAFLPPLQDPPLCFTAKLSPWGYPALLVARALPGRSSPPHIHSNPSPGIPSASSRSHGSSSNVDKFS
jgi:hypothetical protein